MDADSRIHMAESELRRGDKLAMVGLKSGESVEHDMSERMSEFLGRFLDPEARARRDADDDDPDDDAGS